MIVEVRTLEHSKEYRKTPAPKYAEGNVLGGLTIKKYLGFGYFDGRYQRKVHMYEVECSCGKIETREQSYFSRKGSTFLCKRCAGVLGNERRYAEPEENPDMPMTVQEAMRIFR